MTHDRHWRFLFRAALGLAVAGQAAVLAGCAPREPTETGSITTDGYRNRHPIVIDEGEETLDIPVGVQGANLPPRLAQTVAAFGRTAREHGASGITMLVPNGSPNEAAAYRIAQQLTAALVDGGIPAHAITRRPYAATEPDDAAPIRLSYPRIVARVPHECGRWPDAATADFSNGDFWNFGCATQANIAAMVDQPTDLVSPAPLGTPDATRRAAVLQAYRKGAKTKSDFAVPETTLSKVGGGS